jgi:hypothetical protein
VWPSVPLINTADGPRTRLSRETKWPRTPVALTFQPIDVPRWMESVASSIKQLVNTEALFLLVGNFLSGSWRKNGSIFAYL